MCRQRKDEETKDSMRFSLLNSVPLQNHQRVCTHTQSEPPGISITCSTTT